MTMRLFILQPETVWTAQINQASFDYPIGEITYDSGTAVTTPRAGMTVLIGTAVGDDSLGRVRLRVAPSGATGQLKISRASQGLNDGELVASENAYITIINEFRVWSKIPYIDGNGTIYKDHDLAYSDQTDESPPVANGGTAFCGTIDGSNVIAVDLTAAGSFPTASGASITGRLWNVGDGTITVGGNTSTSITATFPAGFRYVSLTVTDNNGKSHVTYIPIYARDPANDTTIQNFQITRHTISKEGQQLSLQIFDSIPEGTYPDGTLVMIWEDEPTAADDRTHMIFTGWHNTDPAQIQATRTGLITNTTLECLDVAGKLDVLAGFPISIENKSSPSSWLEMKSANMDKYLHYLLYWHSTALEVAPFNWSGTGATYPFVILGSEAQSLWDQVARRANSLVPDYHLVCDSFGEISVKVDPMLQDTGDRTATTQWSITADQWSDIQYTHTRPPAVYWLRGEAIVASNDEIRAVFTVAPGQSPGQGETEFNSGEQLTPSQMVLNSTEGHRYARLNADQSQFNITLVGNSRYGIEPAAMNWVRLTAPNGAHRGLTLSNAKGLCHQIDVRYQYAPTGVVKTFTLQWERETIGIPAESFFPPVTPDPPPYVPDPVPPDVPSSGGLGTVYVMTEDTLGRTRGFSASSPTWSDITPSGSPTCHDFILDPWSPTDTGFLLTDGGLYKSTNLDGTPTWTNVLSDSDMLTGSGGLTFEEAYRVAASINSEGYVWVSFSVNDGTNHEAWVARTINGGTAWTYHFIGESTQVINRDSSCFGLVPHLVNGAHILYKADGNGFGNLYKSTDNGTSWTLINSAFGADFDRGRCIHAPYDGNEDGNTVYIGGSHLAKSTDGGTTISLIQPSSGETAVQRTGIESYTGNKNYLANWTDDDRLYTSVDGGANWTRKDANGLSGDIMAAGGFPYLDARYYVVTDEGIYLSEDGGQSFVDKTGDWAFGFTDETVLSGFRTFVIVPVWVAE